MATTLHTYLGYRDAATAIDWLSRAFGFETTMRFPEQGEVWHAELRLGDAALVVFSDTDGYERPPRKGDTAGTGVYLALDEQADVDRLYATAIEAGATSVWEPAATDWNYRCRVLDPEGYEWSLATHRPGAPATW